MKRHINNILNQTEKYYLKLKNHALEIFKYDFKKKKEDKIPSNAPIILYKAASKCSHDSKQKHCYAKIKTQIINIEAITGMDCDPLNDAFHIKPESIHSAKLKLDYQTNISPSLLVDVLDIKQATSRNLY